MESLPLSRYEKVKKASSLALQSAICAWVLSVLAYAGSERFRRVADDHVLNPLIEKALGLDPNMDTDHAPYIPIGPW